MFIICAKANVGSIVRRCIHTDVRSEGAPSEVFSLNQDTYGTNTKQRLDTNATAGMADYG